MKYTSKQRERIDAWDRVWCDALKNLLCDRADSGTCEAFTDEEEAMLMLIKEQVIKAARKPRASRRERVRQRAGVL